MLDLISILPDGVECYIQAPSLDDKVILALMKETRFEYYKCIKLIDAAKEMFIDHVKKNSIEEYFQNIEIRQNDKLLFEGHDGVEYGTITHSITIPEWFNNEYIKSGMVTISSEW